MIEIQSLNSEEYEDRPYVILSAAMTLDGKIATKTRDSKISCIEDLKRVHKLRASVDAIMVGIGTVLIDDPKLLVKYYEGRNPIRVVVDSKARIPLNAKVITEGGARTVVAVTDLAPISKVEELKRVGVEVVVAGSGEEVDLKLLMRKLRAMGVRTLMLEGGATLNWSMVKEGLIDEVRVAIAPVIVGGRDALSLVEGEGFNYVDEGLKLKLERVETCGEDLVLYYKVQRRQN
ncbi:MAG: 2,5-diamino-6-(ribosylamino)-4(3H)-pyrimidinone 5'-phosphate reductase [Candidatus Nezhaarchaeales archaeon]